jgi:dihydrofolate synthase/folylpolyglutamate synthase
MRSGKAVVSSGKKAITTLASCAAQAGAKLYQVEQDFSYELVGKPGNQTWHWRSANQQRTALPLPALFGEHQLANAAGVLMVIALLAENLPVSQAAVRQGLISVQLAGRFQVIPGEPLIILDVAHNVDAMKQLAKQLQQYPCPGRSLAVLGMLSDKDIPQALAEVVSCFDEWFIAPLPTARSALPETLEAALQSCHNSRPVQHHDTVMAALQAAKQAAGKQDRLVVFGSFYTVAQAVP